jgi:hypothetical protein
MFISNCVKSGQLFQKRKCGPESCRNGVLGEFKKSFSRSEEKWAFQSLYTTSDSMVAGAKVT